MGGKSGLLFRFWFISVFLIFITSTLVISGPVFAQDDDSGEFTLEEVVVTGSRIARNNNEATSPIVTIDEKMFDQTSTAAIETQLNKLPQFTPTIDLPTSGGDIQPTARNVPGEATVSLRGLGANRSLVLINGRRGTPSGGMMYVDINTIPTAAIQYVEAISGGASATYGADAMAGVVNFIMRDRFEGFELSTRVGMTEGGDGTEYTVSGVMGTNFADDRGNMMMAFAYNDRGEYLQRDNDFYRKLWSNPEVGGFPTRQYFSRFSGFVTNSANMPDLATVNDVMGLTGNPEGQYFESIPVGMNIFSDDNGQAFSGITPFSNTSHVPGTYGSPDLADGVDIIRLNNGVYGYTNVDNYLILPMQRYNLYTQGNYQINDWVRVRMQGYFSKVKTETVQEGAPVANGWGVMIDPVGNEPIWNEAHTVQIGGITQEIWDILQSRDNGGGVGSGADETFQLSAFLPFDRTGMTEVYTYNLVTGLEGDIPGIDWTWEIFVSKGEAETTALMQGFGSLQRLEAIMTAGPNFGEGVTIQGNQGAPGYGFGASTATCTSGLNPFFWNDPSYVSADCWNAILVDIKSKQVMEQTIYEANFQGPIVDLPAGEMKGALGLSTRTNVYNFWNDTIVTEGRSFIEQALGLYPAANSSGKISTDEVYGEVLVPVLKDIPFIKQLDLELGGRRSDYNTTGVSYTFKALANWQTTDWLRFRGGYNKAERSPNMAELFLSPEQVFSFGAARGDVCAFQNINTYSANPEQNPDHWQDVVTLCGQLMEASGDSDADLNYYGVDYRDIASGAETPVDGYAGAGAGNGAGAFPHTVGNPNLKPETADTWTAGVVIDSPIDSIPALMDWRISIDYYTVKVTDAIGEQSSDLVMQQCVDPFFNPTYDPNSSYCEGFPRNATGAVGNLQTSFFNNGEFTTSGIDLQINWGMDLGPGRIGVDSKVNYLISMKSTELAGVIDPVDYTGTFGTTENGLNGNNYEWRAFTNLTYTYKNLFLALRWEWYDKIEQAAVAQTGSSTLTGAPSYNLFGLSGNYSLKDNISINFGIDNLFDKCPPLIGVNTAPATGELTGGAYRAGVYDTKGRAFYLGARVYF